VSARIAGLPVGQDSVATDQLLAYMPFGPEWIQKLSALGTQDPVGGRDVNIRLYRDFDALESYLNSNVKKLRMQLEGAR
jgi:hypothetical protein